jgi:hypothetical protein
MPRSLELDEKVIALSAALRSRNVAHAFGGAIALGYYGEPRATIDIDLNVFVEARRARSVLEILEEIGIDGIEEGDIQIAVDSGQVRIRWDATLVDLFFMSHDFHRECVKHIRDVPLGSDLITILGAEDLMVFKIAFDRRKDWLDIEQVLFAVEIDLAYLRRWVAAFFGDEDPRVAELALTIEKILGPTA